MSPVSAEIKAAIIVGLFLLIVCTGCFVGYQYQSNSNRADAAEKALTQAKTVTANVMTTLSIFNTISQANADAKQRIEKQTEDRVVIIEKAIASDDCAKQPVPSAAVEQLREHANRIRSSSTGTTTSEPAD
ncbi:DUF2570 domain-containing protein [Mangrovibacter phragmitis]|uniref:DUF2570 domain-containing protein n=1 Tax=Mangrovibacter phragmitis TaxID=1691903 RepID=UPI003511DEAE